MQENEIFSKIITALITALNKLSLYPPGHPVIKATLSHAHGLLDEYLNVKKEITFSLSAEGKVLVEGLPVTASATKILEEFISEFKKIQAESITFSFGISIDELEIFLRTLLMKPEDLRSQGGINQVLSNKGARHIEVNLFSFIKVEKGKEVISVEKGMKLAPEDFTGRVTGFLQGELDENLSKSVKEELHYKFIENPQELTGLIKDIITDAAQLAQIIGIIGDSLINAAKTRGVKSKIDLANQIAKFSAQLKKTEFKIQEKEQLEKIKSLINDNADKYMDAILLDAINTEYAQKKSFTSTLKGIVKKFFSKAEEKDSRMALLKNNLLQSGFNQQDSDNFILETEKVLASKPQEKTPKVDKEELERIRIENTRLKEEVGKLQNELKETQALKQEYKKITAEKERVENIISHMAEGLVVVDAEGKVMLMNPVAQKLLNIQQEEAVGKPLRENIKDEHLLAFTKDLKPDSEGNLTKEIELLSQDESTKRVLRTSSARVENQEGRAVGMVTVLNDITRQKELEQLKSDFVTSVSHELRTPLVVIQQSLSILNSEITEKLNDDQKKFMNNAKNNLGRLKNLINDLLDMASIEAGKLKLKFGLFDINSVAQGVVEFMDKWAKDKNVTLEAKLLTVETKVLMDKDRITQVITNLVGNAIKFTPEGGRVSIILNERAADDFFIQPAVEVSIIDTGIGIEQKDSERIFAKFEQAHTNDPTGIKGTGLGLAIAREIVNLHKGKIWVESEVGKGSKFTFLLPKNAKNGDASIFSGK
jgi:PAS domain S-box-containing protein